MPRCVPDVRRGARPRHAVVAGNSSRALHHPPAGRMLHSSLIEKGFSMKRTVRPMARVAVQPLAAAIATVLGGGYVSAALAQSTQIEEIVVTASRRETTIQELPFNIAAIGG